MGLQLRARLAKFSRPVRWSLYAALALLLAEVIYVVTANLVLATRIVDKMVNAAAPDVEMHVGSGWTLWPGRVHVKNVTIYVNDTDLQAMLYVERATANVTLYAMLDRKLEIHGAQATGLRFWMRHRVSAITDDLRERVAAFAPIPNMEPPVFDPVKRAQPKPPKEKMWRFEIHDGSATGNEFWVQEMHYVGPLRGTGGFYFWPLAELTVFPIEGFAEGGQVLVGDRVVVAHVEAHVQATIDRFVMPEQEHLEQLRGLQGRAEITAQLADGDVLAAYEPSGLPKTYFKGGQFKGTLEFRDKAFTEQTKAMFTGSIRSLPMPGVQVAGPVQISGVGKPDGIVEVGLDTAELQLQLASLKSTAKQPFRLQKTSMRVGVQLMIDKPVVLSLGALQGHLSIPSLEWVSQATSGAMSAQGAIESELKMNKNAKQQVNGVIESTLQDVRVNAASMSMAVAGTAKTSIAGTLKLDDDVRTSLGAVEVDFPRFTLRSGSRSRTTWLKARLKELHLAQKPKLMVQAPIEVELGDSAVLGVPVSEQGPFAALAAKWLFNGGAKLNGAVKLTPPAWDFTLDRGRVGAVDAKGYVGDHASAKQGAFWVSAAGFSAGLRIEGDTVHVSPLVSESWLNEQR